MATDRDDAYNEARRRLLKLTAYSVPLVLGTFATCDAAAQATCGPQSCPPQTGCQPNCGPSCGPFKCKPGRTKNLRSPPARDPLDPPR